MLADPRRQKQLQQLIEKLGLSSDAPVRWELLDLALTHPTAIVGQNYERLEFVGDAVVRLAAAEFLYNAYPTADEGELAAIRSALVSDRSLARIADLYNLERYLLISPSALSDRIGRESRLAAALESMLAALYLSTLNLSLLYPWFIPHLQDWSQVIRDDPAFHNYKGALQAWTQAHHQVLPEYRVTEVGQAYGDAERFVAEVWLAGHPLGQGRGPSKKAAEQAAAQNAYLSLLQDAQ